MPFFPSFSLNMESLPVEVLDTIFQYVPHSSYPTCLRVCSKWNILISRHLYTDISMCNEEKMKLFLESMTLYPRCMEAGRHVKRLDLYRGFFTPYRTDSTIDIDIIDVLIHFPNIEKLKVKGYRYIISSFVNPRMPVFSRLNFLCFENIQGEAPAEIMDCYFKFRSTLEYLDLTGLTHILQGYSLEMILSYIGAFAHLDILGIDFTSSLEKDKVYAFNAIINHCPHLSQILYKGTSLNSPDYYSQGPEAKSSLSNIHLQLINSSMRDIYYIKDKFKCLSHLHMIISNKLLNEPGVIDQLMGINSLTDFTIEIYKCHSKDTFNTFWNNSRPSSDSHTNSSKLRFDATYDGMLNEVMILSFVSKYGARSLSSELNIASETVEQFHLTYEDYLEPHGRYLNRLDMTFQEDTPVCLNTMNTLCPDLFELRIECTTLTIQRGRDTIKPNLNLKKLDLNLCDFHTYTAHKHQPFFEDVNLAFPMLEDLHLENPYLDDIELDKSIHTIQLPDKLKKFILLKELQFPHPWRGVVVKEVNGVHEMSWYYDAATKCHYTKTEDVLQKYFWRMQLPVIVFKSSTLEEARIYIDP
ncbi:hypothetical protein BDB01DRAFT_785851 [Pilobolus umbonatus]|nr:hypothetical protein BDB01DRAFT_785851 [Pilobolus umbonatus]